MAKKKSKNSTASIPATEKRRPRRMSYVRIGLVLSTMLVVGIAAIIAGYYARGYRFDSTSGEVSANGILVLKSVPDSAQIFINGQLKTATNTTVPLSPNTYDVTLKKEGFMDWNKRLTIDKEVVTEATAYLFRSAPSLSSMTFSGIVDIIPNDDLTKIAYIVPPSSDPLTEDTAGLWVMEFLNLPLGFSQDPQKVTDGDLKDAQIIWSPDGSQILLTTKTGVYLLETNTLTPQTRQVNVAATKTQILEGWETINKTKRDADIENLPLEIQDVLTRRASALAFSPDEKMVMYTASASGTIPEGIVPELPGSSTQKEERQIKPNQTYIYDIEEDRNFLVDEQYVTLIGDWRRFLKSPVTPPSISPMPTKKILPTLSTQFAGQENSTRSLTWFPTSRHLVLSENGKIVIMDYDGTNQKTVYSGSYVTPHAYPSLTSDRLLILTNLGSNGTLPNLYSLSLR